jgi:hypothetical protein
MAFRFGFLSGFGAGYYLGARAGRERYDQINRALAKARRSPAVETAAEKARSVMTGGNDDSGDAGSRLPVPAPEVTPEVPAANTVVERGDYSSSR